MKTDQILVSFQNSHLKENIHFSCATFLEGEFRLLLKYLFMMSCGEVMITSEQVRLSRLLLSFWQTCLSPRNRPQTSDRAEHLVPN